ncbi:hypothetical protein ACOMHN_049544 [Nucella lapillus]
MSDMETEVEEVSFLPGEKILNKKAVYEPSSAQRCHQMVCSRRWTITILVTVGLFVALIAIIAAFARPGSFLCQTLTAGGGDKQPEQGPTTPTTPQPPKDYISTDGRPFPWKDIRIPRSVRPENYEIFLHPNVSRSVFGGSVRIHTTVVKATDWFVFHVKTMNVTKVRVLRGEVEVEVGDQMEYRANEQYYVKLKQTLAADSKVIIVVEFHAALVKKLAGFYKSTYRTAAGESREIATTHFEPTDARAAFPCFDEPDLKANFSLMIVRDSNHITLFNMPLNESRPYKDGLVMDEYETSVKMSTYLVAFVVCDFKNISSHTKQNSLVRVFAPADQIEQASYALQVAVKVLDYYNEFFGVPYPLPKQDLIAIPDFGAGAMENWGLITFRMTSILYDPQKTSPMAKQWIALTIAHELAHQWFGNIVTMKWWDDLWLNEGFAAFTEYIGAGIAEPSFRLNEQFVLQRMQRAFHVDAFTSSHPIHVAVKDPAEINEIFDEISYDKGASLIAMLQAFIGEKAFKNGLHNYLTKYSYGNARSDDLWKSLQDASNMSRSLTVKDVMDSWILQMGYPVVTVRRRSGSPHLLLTQERFLLSNSSQTDKSPFNYMWKIPITYRTKRNPTKKRVWLNDKEMTLPVAVGEKDDWIQFNIDRKGFYRVNYEDNMWKQMIQQLKTDHTVFTAGDRAGLLDDAFALARAGQLSYDIVFELVGYLSKETEYIPLKSALIAYQYIMGRMSVTDVYPKLQKYMLGLISAKMTSLGWRQQSEPLEEYLQTSLLASAVSFSDKNTIETAKQSYSNLTNVPKNLRSLVYDMTVKYGDDATWQAMFAKYNSSITPSEKEDFLVALTYTTDARRIQLFLRDALDKTIVRSQDMGQVLRQVSGTDLGQMFVWRFLQRNWDVIYQRYGVTSFTLSSILKGVVAPFNTQFDYDEVKAFFKDKKVGAGSRGLKQSLEMVKSHVDWMARSETAITRWLHAHL